MGHWKTPPFPSRISQSVKHIKVIRFHLASALIDIPGHVRKTPSPRQQHRKKILYWSKSREKGQKHMKEMVCNGVMVPGFWDSVKWHRVFQGRTQEERRPLSFQGILHFGYLHANRLLRRSVHAAQHLQMPPYCVYRKLSSYLYC